MTMTEIELRFRPTKPQRAFLQSTARNLAFIGGIGSGKTRASVIKALGMPPKTIGMLVAPTFGMLRDTVLRTFMDIARKQPTLIASFNQSDLHARLFDGKEILFRSADNPERLRGPNLAWAGLDEAALMKRETLDIMLGRLRLHPGNMWFTTTPKGTTHWLPEYMRNGNVEVHRSRTLDNPHLPQAYLDNLKQQYTAQFYRQEVLGEFVDFAGSTIKREWLRHAPAPETMPVVMGVDLAISTRTDADYTAAVVIGKHNDNVHVVHASRTRAGFHGSVDFIRAIAHRYRPTIIAIENVQFQAAVVEQLLRDTNLPILGIKPDRDKLTRFLPLAVRYEQGLVWHTDGLNEYEDELLSFPSGDHDDLVDAAAYAYNQISAAGNGPRVRSL
jgi:predicted phage terminase large subunit-like protein